MSECPTKKVAYASYVDAQFMLGWINEGRKISRERKKSHGKLKKIYLCPHCGLYHTTSQRKR